MLILFNKPYGVISQFSKHEKYSTLKDFIPYQNVYPAGRLDTDSEGLLILTDNGDFQNKISSPNNNVFKTYLVQGENMQHINDIYTFSKGVIIKGELTKPARVKKIDDPNLWLRNPPIRKRKLIPTSLLAIKISEGKNRQVRRMTAAISYPTLRTVTTEIGAFTRRDMQPGEYYITER